MLSAANDVIVLDNGGTHIRIGHIRGDDLCSEFETLSSARLCVPDARKQLLCIINTYSEKHGLTLKAAVLGIPAVLDRENDRIAHCNNIPQLQGSGLRQYLSSALGCTVLFEQDIMLQLLGEWRAGIGEKKSSLFGVYFGTGIGAAYLLNGNPNNPLVQDIQAGHIPIMAEGRQCKCGNVDCVEAYACGHTLTDLALRTGCPVERLFELQHEPKWRGALEKELNNFVLYQAYMLATVSTLFTPGLVVIGGGVPAMKHYPRQRLIEQTIKHLQKPYPAQTIKFAWASLGNSAPLHGALALLDILDKRPINTVLDT